MRLLGFYQKKYLELGLVISTKDSDFTNNTIMVTSNIPSPTQNMTISIMPDHQKEDAYQQTSDIVRQWNVQCGHVRTSNVTCLDNGFANSTAPNKYIKHHNITHVKQYTHICECERLNIHIYIYIYIYTCTCAYIYIDQYIR